MDRTRADRTIIFLPGLRGDEDKTARFRALFGPDVRFAVLGFPELSAPASVLVDIVAIAELKAREIESLQPEGDIWLIGFSFGGCVAYEACRILMARGRRIGFLGLIDAPLFEPGHEWQGPPSRQFRNLAIASLRLFTGREVPLRLMLAGSALLLPTRSAGLRWFLVGFIRRQATSRWRPQPLPTIRSLLVLSSTFFAVTQHLWRDLMPDVPLSYVPVEHQDLLDGDSLAPVFAEFDRHLNLTDIPGRSVASDEAIGHDRSQPR